MSHRDYQYVGPQAICESAKEQPSGTPIRTIQELPAWLASSPTEQSACGNWVATFTISATGSLHVAPRRSEHVACASGGPVRSAGEITFDAEFNVAEISNQSTGFCPQPDSWPAVAESLERVGLQHPGCFTTAIDFRLCPNCNQRNIIKDSWFFCELCGSKLPAKWNFENSAGAE